MLLLGHSMYMSSLHALKLSVVLHMIRYSINFLVSVKNSVNVYGSYMLFLSLHQFLCILG